MADLTVLQCVILIVSSFAGGFIDSVAGGGGLITLPVLLGVGLPPQYALGTNKLQASFGSFSASFNFIRKGEITIKEVLFGVFCTFVGASTGSILVQRLDAGFLSKLIPFLLMGILLYVVLTPKFGVKKGKPKMNESLFYLLFGFTLGFYDGFFGPGTGSFWTAAIIFFLGFPIVHATAVTKTMNFTSNFVALIWFIAGGNVVFTVGLMMALGQIIGARVGSGLVMKKGISFVKPVFIIAVTAIILSLFYKNYIQ